MTKEAAAFSGQRLEILTALVREAGSYVSGEQISSLLGLSRTAVWKHVQELRRAGIQVEAHPRRGYRLQAAGQVLLPETIAAMRKPSRPGVVRLGEPLECYPALPSTNTRARELGEAGAAEGTAVTAWQQTLGRGRLGRAWDSPPGGLWLSLLLRPPLPPATLSPLTLVVAVAVAEGVEEVTGLRPGIKWPNDLLLGGRKFCGILTELAAEMDRVSYLVTGIGMNANLTQEQLPSAAATPPTSLLLEAGRSVSLPVLAAAMLDRLEEWYRCFLQDGFEPARQRWVELSATVGSEVTATLPEGAVSGKAVDLAPDGALIIQEANGTHRRVLAGDVTLRPRREGAP